MDNFMTLNNYRILAFWKYLIALFFVFTSNKTSINELSEALR